LPQVKGAANKAAKGEKVKNFFDTMIGASVALIALYLWWIFTVLGCRLFVWFGTQAKIWPF